MLILFGKYAFASDHPEAPAHIPVHLGIDAVLSAPEIETAAAVHGLVIFPLVEHLGLSVYGRATTHHNYGEVYVGPAFTLGHLRLTPSVGLETADLPFRSALCGDWSSDRFRALAIVEYGGSGAWYHGLANVWFQPLGVGVFAQRYDGFGPWIDLRLPGHLDVWTAGLYDPEDGRLGGIAGLDWHH